MVDSIEVDRGIIIDFDESRSVVGVEIINFSRRKINLNELIKLSSDEIVPVLVACKRRA